MRVLYLRQTRQLYGPEKTLLGFCRQLPDLGYPCELALIYRPFRGDPPEHPLMPLARAEGIQVVQLDGHPAQLGALIRWVRRRAADPSVKVLHTHDYKADLIGMLATRCLKRRPALVATPRHTEATPLLKTFQWLDRQFLDRFDRLTVPSISALTEMRGRADLLARTRVVPHGTDAGQFSAGPPLPDASGAPVVSLVGRLHPGKGHEHFLAAAARVLQRIPNTQFWLAGEGPLRADLEEQTRRLGIASQVRFLGYRPDADRILAASFVTVVASQYESSCRMATEALHLGCPLVATPVGIIPDLVSDGQGGLLVPHGNPEAMAAAILSLLDDRAFAARLVAVGQAAVRGVRSHRDAAVDMAAVYAEALGGRT